MGQILTEKKRLAMTGKSNVSPIRASFYEDQFCCQHLFGTLKTWGCGDLQIVVWSANDKPIEGAC